MKQEIKVRCRAAITLRLEDLTPLQGGLKELSFENFGKLRESILEHGITFPLCVWQDGGKNHVIDGHQRDRVLRKMAEEGHEIPPLPCALIEARDKAEACEKILLINSQYGKMSNETLYEFLNANALDFERISPVLELPTINQEEFRQGYVVEPLYSPVGLEEQGRLDRKNPIRCPECGCEFVPKR